MSETKEIIRINRDNREEIFSAAYKGSYYTILGCGGGLDEWTTGYTQFLEKAGIGTPKQFITFRGGRYEYELRSYRQQCLSG